MRERRPSLEYTGQTTPELLACKDSHSVGSLLLAFEWGIEAKARRIGEAALTEEELLVLAVQAVDREVNNGGYDQFFRNLSRRFTPIVVQSLQRLGRGTAAALTERAIGSLKVDRLSVKAIDEVMGREDVDRRAILDACDKEFYTLANDDEALVQFIENHAERIQLERTDDYPRVPKLRKQSNASKLAVRLMFHKRHWNPDFAETREVAAHLAQENGIPASASEIEGAAALHVLSSALKAGDIPLGMSVADKAFELMRDETSHTIEHKRWIDLLVKSGQTNLADSSCVDYLKYLRSMNQFELGTQNRVLFWEKFVQAERQSLPRAVEFFTTAFPGLDLNIQLPKGQHLEPRAVPFTVR